MQSHSGDASPKVKVEDTSQTIDASTKEEEEELSSGDASPKVEGNELHAGKLSPKVMEEADEFFASSSPRYLDNTVEKPSDVSSPEEEDDEVQVDDPDGQIYDNASNQLVVYDPEANGMGQIEPVPEAVEHPPPSFPNYAPNTHPRVLPSVGAFTVQCANCFKWRLIPTKEKYEEIRETILQLPFVCERAREWRPNVSCDDPADISQDGSRLWAIDKPNIAQPPPGWERLLRIRGEGSTRFADVYYAAPSGKKLRSMVEIQKYLLEHPEYIRAGVTMSQFSFQIPKPLQENYVRKRPARVASSQETQSLEPAAVHPISWVSPDMQDGGSGQSTPMPYFETPILHPSPPAKRRATSQSPSKPPSKQMYNSSNPSVYNQSRMKVEEPALPGNSAFDL